MGNRHQTLKSTSARIGLVATALILALGAVATCIGLIYTRQHHGGIAALWFGLLTGTFLFASMLCLFLKLARAVAGRSRGLPAPVVGAKRDGEYVAEYSLQNRALAIALAVLLGGISIFLVLR